MDLQALSQTLNAALRNTPQPENAPKADLNDIAGRLHAKTGYNFEVRNQYGEDVIKCTNPGKDAMRVTGELQQAGFNALMSVQPAPETSMGLKLEVTISEKKDNQHFPRSTDINTAISNLEKGKIEPEKAVQKPQPQVHGYIRG